MYKTDMGITATQSPVFLFNCLDSDLKDDILRANPGREVTEMTEVELTDAIKSLAVKIESKLVHRIRPNGSDITSSRLQHKDFPSNLERPNKALSVQI